MLMITCGQPLSRTAPTKTAALPHAEQFHQPLAFLSGKFNKTQVGWSILEKEAYAIVAATNRMHWVLAVPEGFDLYTDHNNLIFIFDPLSMIPDLSLGSVRKVLRWAVQMSIYNYVVHHICGLDNVWADLLGRWSANPTIRRIVQIPPLVSASDKEFNWPSESEVALTQKNNSSSRPKSLQKVAGLWCKKSGAVWVPENAADLQLRICVIGHTSTAGHRGQKATASIIRRQCFWKSLDVDVQTFVRNCIHCLSTNGGAKVPRPFGPTCHGTKPNDLIQFDYIEMGPSRVGHKYILMIRDDFSSYLWLFPFENANSENSASAILEWATTFTIPKGFMSDGGAHFQNETVRLVSKGLRSPHHFTLPYTPWSNGAIERVGKEVLRIFRATLSELRMNRGEWPDLVPLLQSALNNAPSPQRRNFTPVEIFLGQEPTDPVQTFRLASTGAVVTLQDANLEIRKNLTLLKELVEKIHPVVSTSLQANRRRARESASRGEMPRFTEGDFVLLAREEFDKGEKIGSPMERA